MLLFTAPSSFRSSAAASSLNPSLPTQNVALFNTSPHGLLQSQTAHSSHPSLPHLMLLVFEAVLEVVCVSLPGYILARMGLFDAEAQKFAANLNVLLFTPCLIFTKLASQLTAEKLVELAIIPFIFIVQTLVSYLCAAFVSRCFRFRKRQSNFVAAMGVFGNSNSLPISLVISLSKTLSGLHWSRIPNDNDDEVGARGILYLLIFQQLGQLLRWSWGYRVLLAPREQYYKDEEERANGRLTRGQERYSDDTDGENDEADPTLVGTNPNSGHATPSASSSAEHLHFESGAQTPVHPEDHHHVHDHDRPYNKYQSFDGAEASDSNSDEEAPHLLAPPKGKFLPRQNTTGMMSFPAVEAREDDPSNKAWRVRVRKSISSTYHRIHASLSSKATSLFTSLPPPIQKPLRWAFQKTTRFFHGLWSFMNPPLWAMLAAIIVASVPSLQRLFFTPGTFLSNSVTRAIEQSGGVAVPLILVVLGANLARNTLPEESMEDLEHPKEERNLIIASLVARMLLPTVIMGPVLALTAKFVPVSILDDPIFVVVCFLLTGAPSALQLAQICQINNVYMGAMARILFQSYVVWILPSTLILVMCALEVVEWAGAR